MQRDRPSARAETRPVTAAPRRLRIAQVAPPLERVPPSAYGGTERIVHELTTELVRRGHDVTVFASGDSEVPGRLVPTVEQALRPAGVEGDAGGWFASTVQQVIEGAADFDVIHSHLEWWSVPLARMAPVPVVATFHGRLDLPWADRLFEDAPDGMVAISRHQAHTHPTVPWTIIHNGLSLDGAPFAEQPGEAFCFVGRVDPEKGIIQAIEIAERTGRSLRIAAKAGNMARERAYYESVFVPALKRAGSLVEYLGELDAADRDQLYAESYATLMPGAWPEPFGLVSIESLACGTPVLARRVGALPEIIRDGVDGFFGDDAVAMAFYADRLGSLDRRAIRERVIERFSAARMTDRYEELYVRMVEPAPVVAPASSERPAVGIPVIPERDPGLPPPVGVGVAASRQPGPGANKPSIPPVRPRPRQTGSVLARLRARTFGGPARHRPDR
jgi:glycosyltransferase involved in cell wall biosynthesis